MCIKPNLRVRTESLFERVLIKPRPVVKYAI